MIIKALQTDKVAIEFAIKTLEAKEVGRSGETIVLEAEGGGPKITGIFSLSEEETPRKRAGNPTRKVSHSIYSLESGKSKSLRMGLNPSELKGCDLFLLINRERLGSIQYSLSILSNLRSMTLDEVSKSVRERGGAIAIRKLPSNRVISLRNTAEHSANFVWYGTSNIHNLAELALTLKTGAITNLPVVFDSYGSASPTARVIGDLEHNLRMFDSKFKLSKEKLFESNPGPSASQAQISVKGAESTFVELGLKKAASLLPKEVLTVDDWYREGMRLFAKRLLSIVGHKTGLEIVSAEKRTLRSLSNENVRSVAVGLENEVGHPVFLLMSHSKKIKTNEVWEMSSKTFAEVFEEGYWASGALIYKVFYAQAKEKSFVVPIYDGSKGNVNLLARKWMREPYGLWACPVGATTIRVEESGVLLDPWVMLELLDMWEQEKSAKILKKIWDTLKVPLKPNEIGEESHIQIGLDGMKIRSN